MLTFFICLIPFFNSFAQQNTQLWGMTIVGGKYGAGVIFCTDSSGNNETVNYNFFKYEGSPTHNDLIQASNGMFYGMTQYGGIDNLGIIFQYDTATNSYIKKFDFSASNGSSPAGSLIQTTDGKFYGMTSVGGTYDEGVIFQYDAVTNIYTKKFDFTSSFGSNPYGSLTQAIDGKLYGMTYFGGANNTGVIFQYDPLTNIYLKKIDLIAINGKYPQGSLIQAMDGNLYGITRNGGTYNAGTIFKYDPVTNTYTKIIDLSSANGSNPQGSLIQANDGKLYGMTNEGGLNNKGVIFQYNPATNTYTKKIDFMDVNGSNPFGSLFQASDEKLYGMTYYGGAYNKGIIFQYDIITGIFTTKVDFNDATGINPEGSLIQASNGKLYGMTTAGGNADHGTILQFDPFTNFYSKKIDFEYAENGGIPIGSLMQASNGLLYGMTYYGGVYNHGVIFQFDPSTKIYTPKINLTDSIGIHSSSTLMEALDGNLYGLTTYGGSQSWGVIFQYNYSTNTFTKKFDFDGSNGKYPYGSLIQATTDGKLYGMTVNGGANSLGVIFQYDPITNTCIKKVDLTVGTGVEPYGSLLQASDGKLYGLTAYGGGVFSNGVLFQYNPATNIYSVKYDFTNLNGTHPYGSLIQATDGNLYGMTSFGGINTNTGTIFKYNLSNNNFTKLYDFSDGSGAAPFSSLMQALDGKLYGMTKYGGTNNMGVIFQYNPFTDLFNKKLDFNNINGQNKNTYNLMPFSNLIEIKGFFNGMIEEKSLQEITIRPNPFSFQSTIHSKRFFKDAILTIYNSYGQKLKQINNISGQTIILNRDNLPNGIYFLRFTEDNKTFPTVKLLIQEK
ncbi:MAG: choice-of-anchor tandem repeat GloVer-containing protein [Bacteroidales bacterium]